ncbi:DUF3253 domain-containing protein [Rhizobiaceae bacterium]|nr:DUF3253 domain-containing protein [Rhizobiaceae bacterium]
MPAAQLATHCPQTRTNLADAIVSMVAERGAGKSICPSEVARQIGGSDEKVWRGLMKPIRAEALRLAAEGKVSVTRKGKPVDGPDFKGIYRIAPRA